MDAEDLCEGKALCDGKDLRDGKDLCDCRTDGSDGLSRHRLWRRNGLRECLRFSANSNAFAHCDSRAITKPNR